MRLPDAIAPYASLLKWLLIALILCVVFVGGCQRGKAAQASTDAKAMQAADGRANHYAEQAAILAATVKAIDDETAKARADAETQAKIAQAAQVRAAQVQADYRKAVNQADAEIADAKKDPECRKQLEMKTCAILR